MKHRYPVAVLVTGILLQACGSQEADAPDRSSPDAIVGADGATGDVQDFGDLGAVTQRYTVPQGIARLNPW
jgi:hypothetical protein